VRNAKESFDQISSTTATLKPNKALKRLSLMEPFQCLEASDFQSILGFMGASPTERGTANSAKKKKKRKKYAFGSAKTHDLFSGPHVHSKSQ